MNASIIGSLRMDVNFQLLHSADNCTSTSGRINCPVPVTASAFFHFDIAAFFEAGKAEHAGHELFLLVIASRHTKYVSSVLFPAQKDVPEIIVTILQESVIAQGTLASRKMDQILRGNLPALLQVSIGKWAERLSER